MKSMSTKNVDDYWLIIFSQLNINIWVNIIVVVIVIDISHYSKTRLFSLVLASQSHTMLHTHTTASELPHFCGLFPVEPGFYPGFLGIWVANTGIYSTKVQQKWRRKQKDNIEVTPSFPSKYRWRAGETDLARARCGPQGVVRRPLIKINTMTAFTWATHDFLYPVV